MKFIADLHIHSHFSMATAKNLNVDHLYRAAQLKGITLVGTGDFTHPGWIAELEEKLEPAEPGLFRLKKKLRPPIDREIPLSCRGPVRFILQTEISSIYKKDGQVRKNHNLIYFPDIKSVKLFNSTLSGIGNITSDGRPILGLDAEKLLQIMLDTSGSGFLIPAHIWTPWFSLYGSKSGFDSIEACFGSLSNHIFAAETGLSSSAPMNWRITDLDGITLISNSDAHSPMVMGRNASLFNTDLSYAHIRTALEKSDLTQYIGTIDMYPEEGKYHYDGHRKCNVRLHPEESAALEGICPTCNKPLTLGVLYRVNQLAARPEGYVPENRQGFQNIIPLTEILSEILDVGPKTKKVGQLYQKALERLGPELEILLKTAPEPLEAANIPLLKEAILRMRRGEVIRSPGFDGEFGSVKLFDPGEKQKLLGQQELFSIPGEKPKKPISNKKAEKAVEKKPALQHQPLQSYPEKEVPCQAKDDDDIFSSLNPEQEEALLSHDRPLLLEAGPGTGKTRTLTAKIAHLILKKEVKPEALLALTFTNRAAQEMQERIKKLVPGKDQPVLAATFHGFCLRVLKDYTRFSAGIADDIAGKTLIREALHQAQKAKNSSRISPDKLLGMISTAKQQCLSPNDPLDTVADRAERDLLKGVWIRYQELLNHQNLVDFEDLIMMVLDLLESDLTLVTTLRNRFRYIFVDEYQDINFGQYRLIKCLSGDGRRLCAIGDPDQSIYGFRGSDNRYFNTFVKTFPNTKKILLTKNYRSTETILEASFQIISKKKDSREQQRVYSDIHGKKSITILEAASEKAEAVIVGKTIEKLMGGISFFSMDSGKSDGSQDNPFSFSDVAVLYRTRKQSRVFAEVFDKAGIPFQTADKEDSLGWEGIKELLALGRIALGRGTIHDLDTVIDLLGIAAGKKTKQRLKEWFYSLDTTLMTALALLSKETLPGIRSNIGRSLSIAAERLNKLEGQIEKKKGAEALRFLAETFDILPRIEASEKSRRLYSRILHEAESGATTLDGFFENLSLKREYEGVAIDAEKVSLMTMHAAKGLEFPVVFITGCETGLIPFALPGQIPDNIEEERRLFYVAMTRAKQILSLTYAKKRRIFSGMVATAKSPFLYDIEERLKEYRKKKPEIKRPPKGATQLELF